MAIDTVSKRRSALGAFQVWPLADATIDASDRRAAAWVYTGFESGTPTPEPDEEAPASERDYAGTPTDIRDRIERYRDDQYRGFYERVRSRDGWLTPERIRDIIERIAGGSEPSEAIAAAYTAEPITPAMERSALAAIAAALPPLPDTSTEAARIDYIARALPFVAVPNDDEEALALIFALM